jgi:positive regulator of sigma E activity
VTGGGGPNPGTDAPPARRAGRLTRLLRWQRQEWADDHELAHAIHGTVVGAAAMTAASLHGSLGEVVVTVLVTVVVYWAAERYARVLSAAVHGPHRFGNALGALRRGRPMIEAAYTPLAVLVVVTWVADNLRTGVLAALVVATLLLGGLGHVAARRAGTSRAGAVGWGAVSAAFGVVIILLKLSLH